MSDDNYWWQAIDNDEHWQWEQMQRNNQQPNGGQTTTDTPHRDTPTKAPCGQEKAT